MTGDDYVPTIVSEVDPSPGPAGGLQDTSPIAGYVLEEKLGAGGFGEVWRASAPGGLSKAVKVVYGTRDESRASAELKALERIKSVRHPFILVLERFEIVDDRLVIVTELAEGSLRDRFEECRAAGLPGIPREELVGYVRDAADALDFMSETHELQHLDVKPENLLLVGGHLKVADFGLVKNVQEQSLSAIAAITPLYAPPESFDGQPGRYSDQYSLAVVYQHMLTGEPPFAGRTAAQLTVQHLKSAPSLSALPPRDRRTIARALSKNPEQRFTSCREMVDELLARRGGEKADRVRLRRRDAGAEGESERGDAAGAARELERAFGAVPQEGVDACRVPPSPELPPATYRPTLVIGAGGVAGRVLRGLKRRVQRRFGEVEVPSLQLLHVDTDSRGAAGGEDESPVRLTSDEALTIPLRAPADYRSKSAELLEWIDRRWLYNVPRTRRTEGIRPLGRLAFVDHARAVREALRDRVEAATSRRAVEASREATGLPVEGGPPRVFVLASMSGGTGSGAVLDAAYAVHGVLSELDVTPHEVVGVLLHGAERRAELRDVAVANTVACLKELRHYARPDAWYRGDRRAGLPDVEDRPAFDRALLLELGEGADEPTFAERTEEVVEFLYRASLTPAAGFFESTRNPDVRRTKDMPIGTFRIRMLEDDRPAPPPAAVDRLLSAMLAWWLDGEAAETQPRVPAVVADCLQELGLSEEAVQNVLAQLAESTVATTTVGAIKEQLSAASTGETGAVLDWIDGRLAARAAEESSETETRPLDAIERQLAEHGDRAVAALRERTLRITNEPGPRLARACAFLVQTCEQLKVVERGIQNTLSVLETDRRELRESLLANHSRPEACVPYATVRFCEAVHERVRSYVAHVWKRLSGDVLELEHVRGNLERYREELDRAAAESTGEGEHSAGDVVTPTDAETLLEVDRRLQTWFATDFASLVADEERDTLPVLQSAVRELLAETGSFEDQEARNEEPPGDRRDSEVDFEPLLSGVGGECRSLVCAPNRSTLEGLRDRLETLIADSTVLADPHDPPVVWHQVDGISLSATVRDILGDRPELIHTARRLHTRLDVDWDGDQD